MKYVESPVPKTLPGKLWSRLLLFLPLLLLFSHSAWAYPIPDTGQTESYTTTLVWFPRSAWEPTLDAPRPTIGAYLRPNFSGLAQDAERGDERE